MRFVQALKRLLKGGQKRQAKAKKGQVQAERPPAVAKSTPARVETPTQKGKKADEKVDLLKPLTPEQPYPIAALGTLGSDMVKALAERTQAPLSLCAQSCLAAMAMTASPWVDIMPAYGGSSKPATVNLKSIAKSGERKSAVDSLALSGIRRLEEELRYIYEDELAAYIAECKAKKQDIDPRREPLTGTLIAQDATYEGLLATLQKGRGFIGLFNADAADLIKGAAMQDDNKLKLGGGISHLWDGSAIPRSRQMLGEQYINRKRVIVHLQFQPSIAAGFIDDRRLDGQGYFARCLISWPESTIGTRFFRLPSQEAIDTVDRFADWTYSSLKRLPNYRPGSRNDLMPRPLKMAADATNHWIRFHDDVERSIGEGGRYALVDAFGSKAAEHANRLAAILAWSKNPDATEIDTDSVDGGIALTKYYIEELLRLRKADQADPEAGQLGKLLEWIQARSRTEISSEELNHKGPLEFRSDWRKVRAALDELASRGYLKPGPVRKTRTAEHVTYEILGAKAA